MTKAKMSLSATVFSEQQLAVMVQKTPDQYVMKRKGRGGREFSYVTGAYVQDRLNQIFGWLWSFEVKDHGNSPKGSIWVLGRLSVLDPVTKLTLVSKEQFGSSEYKLQATGAEVDYADDLKAATTDALKKCASLLGIAADIYADPATAKRIDDRVSAVVAYQKNLKVETDRKESGIILGGK
jgi:hypothetical protein